MKDTTGNAAACGVCQYGGQSRKHPTMFKLRKYQRRRLDLLERLPILDPHADLDDVIRSAEEDRESAKERKRETEAEEPSGSAWPHTLVRSL